MSQLQITRRNNNIEVLSKVINSVAKKYDCNVKFNFETNELCYTGNKDHMDAILKEAANIFNWK